MSATKIEYLDASWTPIAMRCTPVSAGCDHCWHLAMAKRHAANPSIRPEIRAARAGGKPWLDEKALSLPLRWRKPRRIGVQFMGDLFHHSVPYTMLASVWGTMRDSPRHTFVVLTKRMGRGAAWLSLTTPLPNVWLGVSVEDQATADERIPLLLQTPAAVRFVSIEPCLSRIDLTRWKVGLDLVIVGCETGPGATPMNPDWARSVRDQCRAAGVPFFLKKLTPDGNRKLDGVEWNEMPRTT